MIQIDPAREREELEAYLSPRYEPSRLERWIDQLEEEYRRIGDEQELYRVSEAYLYNLTAFAMTGTKLPYLRDVRRLVAPPGRVLDYGCGIGSDGLCLLEAGYRVAFADFDNPSTRYLRWRLKRRGLAAEVYNLDRESPPAGFDLAYAFDVIEHVDDPFSLLGRMERIADRVMVNLLEERVENTRLHRVLPIDRILRHAARQRLVRYRVYHGRSHLVAYEVGHSAGLRRLRSELALWRGRLRPRASAH